MRAPIAPLLAVASAGLVVAACTADAPQSISDTGRTTPPAITTTIAPTTVPTTTLPPTTLPATTLPATTTTQPWQRFPTSPVEPVGPTNGSTPVFNHIRTTDPVVFLTIDDGLVRDPRIAALLAEHHATATLFINPGPLFQDVDYFAEFVALGGTINSHTINHPHLRGLSLEEQRREVCGGAGAIRRAYGFAGGYFRPPYGEYDDTTLRAAASCGIRAALTWRVVLSSGEVHTQGGGPLQPGDIVLTHFRTDLYDNLVTFFAQCESQGLVVARLEDYLPPR
jgi:peptidoglycan/xylan/chitin deacetylase (PgdA/CDA1 family)